MYIILLTMDGYQNYRGERSAHTTWEKGWVASG